MEPLNIDNSFILTVLHPAIIAGNEESKIIFCGLQGHETFLPVENLVMITKWLQGCDNSAVT